MESREWLSINSQSLLNHICKRSKFCLFVFNYFAYRISIYGVNFPFYYMMNLFFKLNNVRFSVFCLL